MDEIDLILLSIALVPVAVIIVIAATWTVLLKHSVVGPTIIFRWDVWIPSRAEKYLTPEGARQYRRIVKLSCLFYVFVLMTIAGVVALAFATAA